MIPRASSGSTYSHRLLPRPSSSHRAAFIARQVISRATFDEMILLIIARGRRCGLNPESSFGAEPLCRMSDTEFKRAQLDSDAQRRPSEDDSDHVIQRAALQELMAGVSEPADMESVIGSSLPWIRENWERIEWS